MIGEVKRLLDRYDYYRKCGIMFYAIVNTNDRGNFLFSKIPNQRLYPNIESKITGNELAVYLENYFYFLGLFTKDKVLEIGGQAYSEQCFLEIFNCTEKRSDVVLGIDDECVLVCKSLFLGEKSKLPKLMKSPNNILYATMEDVDEDDREIVGAISLVWVVKDFQNVESMKNQLSFLNSVLLKKEKSSNYLSKQIMIITEIKAEFDKKLKDKIADCSKQPQSHMLYDTFDVKEEFDNMYDYLEQEFEQISLYKLFQRFYDKITTGEEFEIEDEHWEGSIGSRFKVPKISKYSHREQQEIISQCVLMVQKEIEILPPVLLDERFGELTSLIQANEDKSIGELLSQPDQKISEQGCLHSLLFMMESDIGVNVYPFKYNKFFNTYSLSHMPNWAVIRKFHKIFNGQHILHQLLQFNKYKSIHFLTPELKYIILKGNLSEVDYCVYHIPNKTMFEQSDSEDERRESNQVRSVRMILEENTKGPNVANQVISKLTMFSNEPLKSFCDFASTYCKRKINSSWGMYFVEK